MALAFLLALQAAAAPAAAPPLAIDFDLASFRSPLDLAYRPCSRAEPGTIVVCGRGGGAYPMAEMARRYAPHRLVAERGLTGNLVGDVHLEQASFPADRGAVAHRIMVGLRLPF